MLSKHRGQRYRLTERGKRVLLLLILGINIIIIFSLTGELNLL